MNVYDYAMEMERDGELYYRELAAQTENAGLRTVLNMLADAEVQHRHLFAAMKEKRAAVPAESKIIEGVINVFRKLRDEGGAGGTDVSEADLYRKAQALEAKTRDFYLERAGEETDEGRRAAFLAIAEEEKRHFRIMQGIVDFVSQPEQWIENAEWYHLEDY